MPENTDEGEVVPASGTVVSGPPTEPPRPVKKAGASRAQRPESTQPRASLDDVQEEEEPAEEPAEAPADPRATRILSVEALEGPARYELLVTVGPARGARFPLTNGAHTVGRSAQCDCSILDEAVSRRHFELQVDASGVMLRDLGSGNGTLVNGERADEVNLVHGDVLQIGDSTLEFREKGRAPISQARRQGGAVPTQPRLPAARGKTGNNNRTLLIAAVAVFAMFIFFLVIFKFKQRQEQLAAATAAFDRGRQELDQGDADAALDDFQRALRFYPDPTTVQEKIAAAHVISEGSRSLTHAKDLMDQKDFEGASKVLDGIPHNDYLDQQVTAIRADLAKRQADLKAAQQQKAEAGNPIDPTTAAEAHDYYTRAKKELLSHQLDAADQDMGRAYDMLASKGAGGPEFDELKLDYVDLLKQVYVRFKRSNPARAEIAAAKANGILPDAIPPGGPIVAPPTEEPHPKRQKHPRTTRRHASYSPLPQRQAGGGGGGAVASPSSGGGGRYNESRAEELDDEGDALLGQNPDAAKDKYRAALKLAPPDSDAAQRARAGLGN
ncbi:MAG TPA: FHA domain-containing protein [Myxococcales bacterium]|nr:FHA domain-containing protein [Myxococcales bacterium]